MPEIRNQTSTQYLPQSSKNHAKTGLYRFFTIFVYSINLKSSQISKLPSKILVAKWFEKLPKKIAKSGSTAETFVVSRNCITLIYFRFIFLQEEPISEEQKAEKRAQYAVKETEFLRLKRSRLGVDDFEPLKVKKKKNFQITDFFCPEIEFKMRPFV